MVPSVADPAPEKRFSTELMTAFVFGEEYRADPKPGSIRPVMMNPGWVSRAMNVNRQKPAAENPVPMEATTLGYILSESLPARGEKTAITTG